MQPLLVFVQALLLVLLPIAVSADLDASVKSDLDDLAQKAKDFQLEFAEKVDPVVSNYRLAAIFSLIQTISHDRYFLYGNPSSSKPTSYLRPDGVMCPRWST